MNSDRDRNEAFANTPGYDYPMSSWPARDSRTTRTNIDPMFTAEPFLAVSTSGMTTWPGTGDVPSTLTQPDDVLFAWPKEKADSERFEPELFSPIEEGVAMSFKQEWSPQPSSPSLETTYPFSAAGQPRIDPHPKSSRRTDNFSKPKSITPKLRTAARKPRKSSGARSTASRTTASSSDPDESVSPEELRARRNHNLVEKQYRNRLNSQFERLLSVLPPEHQRPFFLDSGERSPPAMRRRPSGSSSTESAMEDKRMSKAEVLDVATRRIKELEEQRARLIQEKTELLQSMEVVNNAVAEAVVRGRVPVG